MRIAASPVTRSVPVPAIVLLLALALLALLAGCAGAPALPPIPRGTPLAITSTREPGSAEAVPIRNQAVGDGAAVGAGSGIVMGGLWGLACGPFAPLCVPLGASLGMVTGWAAGAVIGITGALPDAKAEQLRGRLARAQQSHDILDGVRDRVSDRARRFWLLDGAPADTTVTLALYTLRMTSTRDERVSLTLQVLVSVERRGVDPRREPFRKLYTYIGPLSAVDIWLAEGSDFVDTSLSSASEQLAAEIVSELALER